MDAWRRPRRQRYLLGSAVSCVLARHPHARVPPAPGFPDRPLERLRCAHARSSPRACGCAASRGCFHRRNRRRRVDCDQSSCVPTRHRRRVREQGVREHHRQGRRGAVQSSGQAVRTPHELVRRDTPEPAELHRARVRLDAGNRLELHEMLGRRPEPRRHPRRRGQDLEDICGGAALARFHRRILRRLREEAQPLPLLRRHRLERSSQGAGRPVRQVRR